MSRRMGGRLSGGEKVLLENSMKDIWKYLARVKKYFVASYPAQHKACSDMQEAAKRFKFKVLED